MGIWQRIFGSPAPAAPPAEAPRRRDFQAAVVNRLTASFSASNASINADLEGQLAVLRGRSRTAYANYALARRAVKLAGRNIVGPKGFTLQSKCVDYVGDQPVLDTAANAAIVNHWGRWSRVGSCDVTGRLSFPHLSRLVCETVAREGEALVRKVRSRNFEYGFRLQVLDIDRLDEKLNVAPVGGGNAIRMGVEIDSMGAAVAFHLFMTHPNDSRGNVIVKRERVPASDIYHIFLQDRPEQIRGYPWSHAILARLNMLDGFQEAAVVAARVGAAKMGFFTTPDGEGAGLGDTIDPSTGELQAEAEPGKFGVLPAGTTFESFDPDYPHAFFDPFVKAITRELAVGQSIAYHNLSGDMSGVNYSSARIDELGERDEWSACQEWFSGMFVSAVAMDWLETALIRRAITLPNGGTLAAEKLPKYSAGLRLQGRRWQWVDPKNDVDAQTAAIDAKLKSRTQVSAEQGIDFDETLADLSEEERKMDELGLNPAPAAAPFKNGGGNA
jgi:lambda family phage portal protein